MTDTLGTLRRQHAHTRGILMILDDAIGRYERDGRIDPYLADAVLEYLAAYPRDVHRPVEAAVYDALNRANPASAPATQEITAEHPELEEQVQRLRDQLFWSRQLPAFPREQATAAARRLIAEMNRHMDEEEQMLFPLAERMLNEAAWAEVDAVVARDRTGNESPLTALHALRSHIAALAPSGRAILD